MEEYRIDLKVRNNLILSKIESLGYRSIRHFCQETGFCYQSLMMFTNMKVSIFDTLGRIKPAIKKLCDKLNCLPEEIFSANQMETALKTNKKTIQVREAEMIYLMNQSNDQSLLEHIVEEEQLKTATEIALSNITPREKEIISMRFGLGKYEGQTHTLEEIGNKFDVTRDRIRQIEAKALRKLRHPRNSEPLKQFIYDVTE